jgi:putative aminopeptidase FrvX
VKPLIKKLAEAYGPPGREADVRQIIAEEVAENVQSVEISPMGSLHAFINKGGKRRVMLVAHMDETGIIVSHIDKHGCARFQPMGIMNLEALPGHGVRFPGDVVGVFGVDLEQCGGRPPQIGDFFIDFGVDDIQSCPVGTGDIGVFDRPFLDLGGRLVAKSLCARIGVAILIEVIHQISECPDELQFAFTVQGEVGRRGGTTSAYMLDPEVGIAVEATDTGDTPQRKRMPVALGKGPAIKLWDSRMLSDPCLVRRMANLAKEAGIACQMDVLQSGDAEAPSIQLTRAGISWGCISIPTRYMHTPSEMVDYGDVEDAVRLLLEISRSSIDFAEGDKGQDTQLQD